jgi:uncharacterized protein with HEPN domain
MHDRAPKFLFDAVGAIDAATSFIGGASLDQYIADAMLRSALERQLEILGEACGRLDKLDPSWSQAVLNIRVVIGLRNRIIHCYVGVDHAKVCDALCARPLKVRRPLFLEML